MDWVVKVRWNNGGGVGKAQWLRYNLNATESSMRPRTAAEVSQGGLQSRCVERNLNNKGPGRACSGAFVVRFLCPAFDVCASLLGDLSHT